MPPQLHDKSPENMPNLPLDFNLTTSYTTTINTRSNIPGNVLPQRPNFATQTITTNDTTQPFNYNQPERRTTTTTTTASYKRRQRRIPQQQYHTTTDQNEKNYNRFTALEQIDTSTDIESNYDDETNDVLSIAEYDIADHNEKEQMK
ncbi:unnamed protein product [Rotaria sp. Silwood1]|nr:unnamed protein product [Rotaria sp. Silwood1]